MNGLVMGKRRRGKTTLALHLAKALAMTICVFDTNRQFYFPQNTVSEPEDLENRLRESAEMIVFRPGLDLRESFKDFSRIADQFDDLTLLLEESWRFQGGNFLEPWLDHFVRERDPEHFGILQTFHRPSDSANACRMVASDWYIFQTRQARSLEVVADQCGAEVAEKVASLEFHQYVHWDDDAESFEVVTDSASWFESLREPDSLLASLEHERQEVSL